MDNGVVFPFGDEGGGANFIAPIAPHGAILPGLESDDDDDDDNICFEDEEHEYGDAAEVEGVDDRGLFDEVLFQGGDAAPGSVDMAAVLGLGAASSCEITVNVVGAAAAPRALGGGAPTFQHLRKRRQPQLRGNSAVSGVANFTVTATTGATVTANSGVAVSDGGAAAAAPAPAAGRRSPQQVDVPKFTDEERQRAIDRFVILFQRDGTQR